ncbi:hypothetical protein AAIR29_06820 [Psychrobacter sp. FBL11]|uniref:Uncharacterized protein n=1 Tax=Psychrobacter saeujeotis TaxID=3143436 RepID=A0ABU9XBD8_9GAMM|nr:hypothetical protein [uncultured Psychrobacter sp.]
MYFFNNKNLCFFSIFLFITPFIGVAHATDEEDYQSYIDSIPRVQLKMIPNSKEEVNEFSNQTDEPDSMSYIDKLNEELAINGVPFRYIDYEYEDGEFTTYPFELVNEKLPTIEGSNPNYNSRYDKAFQKMIYKLVSPINLADKELYAMGSQREGIYIQDINTDKKYVFNKICFDNKCAIGQVFYIFDPESYEMTGMLYDGCSFITNDITGNDQRTKELLQKYIDVQNPLDYSYAPDVCKKQLSIAKEK